MCDMTHPAPLVPQVLTKTMASCYLVLCVLAGVQLLRTVVHRHKKRSFRFGFLMLCWIWTALRVVFWFALRMTRPSWPWRLIYSLPSQCAAWTTWRNVHCLWLARVETHVHIVCGMTCCLDACQVGTFSLLILFYAKLVHRHRWRALRVRFLSFCILSNTAMVFLTVAYSVIMERVERAQHADPSNEDAAIVSDNVYKMYYLACALFFGVLVILAAFYIHKLRTARRSTAGTSRQEVAVTIVVFTIFLSRCIWDALAGFDEKDSLFRLSFCERTDTHVKLMAPETFVLLFVSVHSTRAHGAEAVQHAFSGMWH